VEAACPFEMSVIYCIAQYDFTADRIIHSLCGWNLKTVAYPGILFGKGGSTNSFKDRGQREWGYGVGSPLVRGSGGSCNLVQEISFHIVKFS
jgi:hypothetical protein